MEERGCVERTSDAWKRVSVPGKLVVCKEMVVLEEVTMQKGEAKQYEASVVSFI